MTSLPSTDAPEPQADRSFEQRLREMNEALLVSSVHQHELTEQAQKAEVRYRRLFETAKDGILILDAGTGRISDANPFMSDLLGYAHDEFLAKELWEIGLFCDKSANQAAFRELQEKRSIRYENLPLETKHGKACEVEVVANVYTENHHSVIQCNIRDITERRTTERALEKALSYGDDIIATLREPFLILDVDLRVRTANRAFYDSFHVCKEQTENRFVYDLGNGQWDIPGLRALLDEVLSRSQSIHDFEVEHTFPELGRKTMLLNARPFPPDSNNPELILLAVYDISAERARADELAEASRQKDEFLAMLGHELRSPLAPIANAVQLLALRPESESLLQRQARGIIERQVAQLQHLIDDLLEVSRITTGRIQLQLERLVARGIVEAAVETVRPLIEKLRHELTVSLPSEPIWLCADAARLQQVLVNLLTNAAKYTVEGGHIWLTVELDDGHATRRREDQENSPVPPTADLLGSHPSQIVIRVRDTGIGISSTLLPRIFELFTQGERSLDRSQGGLGIGLALVKRLAELHGGTVEAESKFGQGSEFVVRLPVAPLDALQPMLPDSETDQPATRALRVLAVDDNVDTVVSFSLLLRSLGHDVRTAHDGLTALHVALEYQPDVVLLDIGLPGLNGYEVAKRIRREPTLKHVVLVALTGYGQGSDQRTALQAGFNHHLVKPVRMTQLEQILATVPMEMP